MSETKMLFISIATIAHIIERKFDLKKIGSSLRTIRRSKGVYACDRSNKAYKKLEGNKGQLNIVLKGLSRTQVKNMLKGVHTLQQVKGSKDKIHKIDVENEFVMNTFLIQDFILLCCPKNKEVSEFFEHMTHEELIEFFVKETNSIGRKLEKSL